jgi:hypothetical protein
MNATINKVYGATRSEKNGNIYLACSTTMCTDTSLLGQGVESYALVNIALQELSEGIASLLTQDPDNPNRFTATDVEAQDLQMKVTLRDVRPHAEKDGVFWATV